MWCASSENAVRRPERGLDVLNRGRRSIAVDLKHADGVGLCGSASADALIEGFRPGVAERLGIGPDDCLARNPGSSTGG